MLSESTHEELELRKILIYIMYYSIANKNQYFSVASHDLEGPYGNLMLLLSMQQFH